GAAFGTRLYPRMAGLLLYAALGAVATSGPVGGVYTHVITEADDVPWLTLHGKMGGEYYRLQDAKLDELTLSWDGPGPLKAAAKLIGENLDFPAAWTATNSEADNAGGKFRGAGGSFKADVDSAVPVTAPVKAGEVKFTNGLSAEILSDSIRPQEIFPTVLVPSVSLTLKPDDLLRWREAVTGSAAGTAIQDTPVYGSFEVKFVIDANTDLVIAATRVPFLAEFPEANPSGEPAELVLVGEADKPSAGAAITATLRNAQASY
ncbi:MAG: phage tail tube protein, partial [Acidimicrobiia bacterium]